MFRFLIYVICSVMLSSCAAPKTEVAPQLVVGDYKIIPAPEHIRRSPGYFTFRRDTTILSDDAALPAANYLREKMLFDEDLDLAIVRESRTDPQITLVLDPNADPLYEGYEIEVEPAKIALKGNEKGLFYAIQTLRQMVSRDRYDDSEAELNIPAGVVVDSPRFGYRGMHLDVARHYFPPDFVKRYIDLIAQFKFNHLHWHLTDDQGWRIEIKKYPRLTAVGSERSETVKADAYPKLVGDGKPVSGFYSHNEIRDIVEFARVRQVTIVPEIDVPAHSASALAAYPRLGCKKGYSYKVKTTWGGFPDIYCPTQDTFSFLEDVFAEVIDLFPNSPYIHIGGDEVSDEHWRECNHVQALKKHNGFTREREVQGLFVKRIADFLKSRGRRVITWDETVDSTVRPESTVMVWRKYENAVTALRLGHDVIMTPSEWSYLDHPQSKHPGEPRSIGAVLPLRRVYDFEPMPKNLPADLEARVIGGQGCVWTEFIPTPERAEYMAFPRAIALAEVMWSSRGKRNYEDFASRLPQTLARLDRVGVNYRIPEPTEFGDGAVDENGAGLVELSVPINGGRIHYTLDGTNPGETSEIYTDPIRFSVGAGKSVRLRVVVFSSNERRSDVYESSFTRPGKKPGEKLVARKGS